MGDLGNLLDYTGCSWELLGSGLGPGTLRGRYLDIIGPTGEGARTAVDAAPFKPVSGCSEHAKRQGCGLAVRECLGR